MPDPTELARQAAELASDDETRQFIEAIATGDDKAIRDLLEERALLTGIDLLAIAALSLACKDVDVTVIGPVSIKELREDVAALDPPLTEDELEAIASETDYPNRWG